MKNNQIFELKIFISIPESANVYRNDEPYNILFKHAVCYYYCINTLKYL